MSLTIELNEPFSVANEVENYPPREGYSEDARIFWIGVMQAKKDQAVGDCGGCLVYKNEDLSCTGIQEKEGYTAELIVEGEVDLTTNCGIVFPLK